MVKDAVVQKITIAAFIAEGKIAKIQALDEDDWTELSSLCEFLGAAESKSK